MDKPQKERIALLEKAADISQLRRDNARDLLDIALHQSKQPNTFVLKNHLLAFALAGCVGFGGLYAQLERGLPYGGVGGAGIGLAIGLWSNARDDARQSREKKALVATRQARLAALEKELAQKVQAYREEEEIGWLMLALGTSKCQLLALQEWLADPRREMKDAVLASVDILLTHYTKQELPDVPTAELLREREFRTLRDRLFSEEVQIQKAEFMQRVASRHTLRQEQEKAQSQKQAESRVATTSAIGGTAAGVVAGVAAAGIGSELARTLGASKNTANWVGAIGGAAAVVGVGLLAANALGQMMRQAEAERQRREEQNFQAALVLTRRIWATLAGSARSDAATQIRAATVALQKLEDFQNHELRTQDRSLQEHVAILKTCLQNVLRASKASGKNPSRGFWESLFG
ncbi:MAG: hypothetical protein SNJ60_02645 [Pseudanabaenaceae cyanobacterium]